MQKSEVKFIFKSFLIWRILLFLPVFLAPFLFELQKNFLGGGLEKYLANPYFYSFANFDGEHYLSIANIGYGNGEQAFFPLYPLLIKFFGGSVLVSQIISNIFFIVALFGFYKLVKFDYKEVVARKSIIFLLIFPGSFYFASSYTESLFLALVVWSFYFYKIKNYFFSSILGIFSSATRVVGVVLLPSLLINNILKKKLEIKAWPLLAMPLGILSYMFYLKNTWNDPLKFFNVASGFGEQRSDHLILLPQVFYRYIVKIIPNLSWDYFPVVFITLMELSIAVALLILIIYSFRKINWDYWVYLLLIYLIPTLSGSFSSLPRYVLVAFPIYILMSLIIKNTKAVKFVAVVLITLSVIMQMLFVRGYFVS